MQIRVTVYTRRDCPSFVVDSADYPTPESLDKLVLRRYGRQWFGAPHAYTCDTVT